MPARKSQLWPYVLLALVLAIAISVAYHFLRASNIQIAQGRQAYDAGRYEHAEAAFARAVEVAPDNSHAWFWLGMSRKCQGKSKPAAEALMKASTLAPDNVAWRIECAEALQWAERFTEAEQVWNEVLARVPPDGDQALRARLNLAEAIAHQGQTDRAVEMLNALLARRDDRRVRFTLAQILVWGGRLEESAEQYRRALPDTRPASRREE